MHSRAIFLVTCAAALLAACGTPRPTPADAKTFINGAEQKLLALNIDSGRADWIKATYITDDTEDISAKLDQRAIDAQVDYAKQSTASMGSRSTPSPRARSKSSSLASPSPRRPTRRRRKS